MGQIYWQGITKGVVFLDSGLSLNTFDCSLVTQPFVKVDSCFIISSSHHNLIQDFTPFNISN